jgi:hypothetical protein
MNLAVLTGRQISRPLKVFIVSQAGEVADVTLNSLCTSKDQSVLKVRSGSEMIFIFITVFCRNMIEIKLAYLYFRNVTEMPHKLQKVAKI